MKCFRIVKPLLVISILFLQLCSITSCSKSKSNPAPDKNSSQITAIVSTFAGNSTSGSKNDTGTSASFVDPIGVAADASGNVYVADYASLLIRKITPNAVVTTYAGTGQSGSTNGLATIATFTAPQSVVMDANGNLYVADYSVIRKITPDGNVTTFVGAYPSGTYYGSGTTVFSGAFNLAIDASGNIYYTSSQIGVGKISPDGAVSEFAVKNADGTGAPLGDPNGIAVDASGNIYISDDFKNVIYKITPQAIVSVLAGSGKEGNSDGKGTAASFSFPAGLAVDKSGNVYVADDNNALIRMITPDGTVTTLAGGGNGFSTLGEINGVGTKASFRSPSSIAIDANGNLYIADPNSHLIRKIVITKN